MISLQSGGNRDFTAAIALLAFGLPVSADAGSVRFCYGGEKPVYMALQNPTNFMARESWGWIKIGGSTSPNECRSISVPGNQRRYIAFATFNSNNEMMPLYVTSPGLSSGGQTRSLCVLAGALPGSEWRHSGDCGYDAVTLKVSFVLVGGSGPTHVVEIPNSITDGAEVSEDWKRKSASAIFEP